MTTTVLASNLPVNLRQLHSHIGEVRTWPRDMVRGTVNTNVRCVSLQMNGIVLTEHGLQYSDPTVQAKYNDRGQWVSVQFPLQQWKKMTLVMETA